MALLRLALVILLLTSLPAMAQEAPPAEPEAVLEPAAMEDMNVVVLRTIDKLSARTHTFDIPVDKTVKFSNSLFIKARACRRSSPLARPESAAFLQIWERKPTDIESRWVFSGWMFSSSPSVSAMDHPVYDVWLIECKNASTSAKAEEFSSETAPAAAPEKTETAPAAAAPEAPDTGD